jgi:hypothetical protein
MTAPVQSGATAAFDIAPDAADGVHVLDDVGAGQPATQLGVEAKADAGQDFAETLQDSRGDQGSLLLQLAGEVASQSLGIVSIIPRLTQCVADRGVWRL